MSCLNGYRSVPHKIVYRAEHSPTPMQTRVEMCNNHLCTIKSKFFVQTRPCHSANSSSLAPLTLSSMIPRILSLFSFPARCSMNADVISKPKGRFFIPNKPLNPCHTHPQSLRYWSKRSHPLPNEPSVPNQLKGWSFPKDQAQTTTNSVSREAHLYISECGFVGSSTFSVQNAGICQ